MPRFLVTGVRHGSAWGVEDAQGEEYIRGADRDAALRKGRWHFSKILAVAEVGEDEGRGFLWRLWQRFLTKRRG